MDIKTLIKKAKESHRRGWALVEYVRLSVNDAMSYSNDVPYLFHENALKRGKGYCVQQALCVRDILKALDIECEVVYCKTARFPDKLSGHTWNRVTIDGETRDVCSVGRCDTVGNVSFMPQSPVRKYSLPVMIAGYLGSIPVCFKRKHAKL